MTAVYTHNVNAWSVACGTAPISGWGPQDAFTATPVSDAMGDEIGIDGDVTSFIINDDRWDVSLKLQESSPSNDILTALYLANKASANGTAYFTFLAQDNNGRTKLSGSKAWIMKLPPVTVSGGVNVREWGIRVADMAVFIGGLS
jgi:hypothetical protein